MSYGKSVYCECDRCGYKKYLSVDELKEKRDDTKKPEVEVFVDGEKKIEYQDLCESCRKRLLKLIEKDMSKVSRRRVAKKKKKKNDEEKKEKKEEKENGTKKKQK